jgi:hypothetical protein
MLLLFSCNRAFSNQLRHPVSPSYVCKCQLGIFIYPTREANIRRTRIQVFSYKPRLILHDLIVSIVDVIIDIIDIKLNRWLIILNIINIELNLLVILPILVRLNKRKVYRLNIIHSLSSTKSVFTQASKVNSIIPALLLVIVKKRVLATAQLFSGYFDHLN